MHIDLDDMPEPDFEKFEKDLDEVIARLGGSQDVDLEELLSRTRGLADDSAVHPAVTTVRPGRTRITIRIPNCVLDACRREAGKLGIPYQALLNRVLAAATSKW